MHLVDDVPLVVGHVGKSLVAKDTSIVDENINAAVLFNGGLDNCLAILHIGLVADCLSTKLLNLLNNVIGVDEIVNNDLCAALGQLQAVDAAKTSTATSDKRNLALEVQLFALRVARQLLGLFEKLQCIRGAMWVFRLGEVDNFLPLGCNSARR